ncbi:MAG: hypothetical protein NTV70_23005 [Acidobacteria bacterium]|nr:hypothetical protein [Acidobacteriota bacterium]
MIPALRQAFNASFTPEAYARFLAGIDSLTGTHIPFRHNETPVFIDEALLDTMARSGQELLAQVVGNARYHALSDAIIPAQYRVRNEAACPLFVQADFGIIRNAAGALEPRLVEIQGFPSLYAYQPVMAETYRRAYGLDPTLKTLLSGLDLESYWALLRHAILGDQEPENVILLEIDPEHQKTACDFHITEQVTGVKAVCITKIRQEGRQLYYERDGQQVPIHRIYNRCIVDELERKGITAPFDWTADLDVEWAGHPNWYFRLSKFTIPFFDHPHVPRTLFLDRVESIPEDLDNWVLKPLYSFAGLGVSVGPTRAEVDAVTDRENWILQERVRWEPVIETPHGPTQVEVRIMYLWFEGGQPQPVNTIIRTGRGKMMGVDHNKGLDWVGASAAFYR